MNALDPQENINESIETAIRKPSNETNTSCKNNLKFDKKTSLVCIACGHNEFDRVPPKSTIAYAKDYKCRNCSQQYDAPIPFWGAVAMIALGGLVLLFGCAIVIASAMKKSSPGVLAALSILGGGGFVLKGLQESINFKLPFQSLVSEKIRSFQSYLSQSGTKFDPILRGSRRDRP